MPETYTITVTSDELNMIAYALKEMGNKRLEQGVDRKNSTLTLDAQVHYNLAERIYKTYDQI